MGIIKNNIKYYIIYNICYYILSMRTWTSKKFFRWWGVVFKNAAMGNPNCFFDAIYNKFVGLMPFPIATKSFPIATKNLCNRLRLLDIFSNSPYRP